MSAWAKALRCRRARLWAALLAILVTLVASGALAPALAVPTLTLTGPGNQGPIAPDANGRFAFPNAPLKKNSVNKFTVTAKDDLGQEYKKDISITQLSLESVVVARVNGFVLSGTGEIIEPDDGVFAIGSGGPYAQAAARALLKETALPAKEIVQKALEIAGEICIYTNQRITVIEPS